MLRPFFVRKLPVDGTAAVLKRDDVFRLRAFFTLRNRKLHLLTFSERFEAAAADRAEMYEYIGTAFRRDKAKTFGFIEPFDGTGGDI